LGLLKFQESKLRQEKNSHFFILHLKEVNMHHLLLLLPLVGLVLFVYFLWQVALPLYVIIFIASLALYWKIIKAQRRIPVMGKRAMIGDQAAVVKAAGDDIEVHYQGEIWRAVSSQPLHIDQKVIIQGVEGLVLRVKPAP
jgi:membrane protein implicated in regulation of membrane protease activity